MRSLLDQPLLQVCGHYWYVVSQVHEELRQVKVNQLLGDMRYKRQVCAAHMQMFKDGMMEVLADTRAELETQLEGRIIPDSGPSIKDVLDKALDIFVGQKTEAQESSTRRKLLGQKWIEPTQRLLIDSDGERSACA